MRGEIQRWKGALGRLETIEDAAEERGQLLRVVGEVGGQNMQRESSDIAKAVCRLAGDYWQPIFMRSR